MYEVRTVCDSTHVIGSVVCVLEVSVVAVGDVDDNDTDVCRVSPRSSVTLWLQ